MQANDIMTTDVATIRSDTDIRDIVNILLKHRISAVPVTDAENHVLGIISEGDLIRRAEEDEHHHHGWSLESFFSAKDKVREYIKTHGRTAGDIMTRKVISITMETPLHMIARKLTLHHLDRVPVIHGGRLVGMVSRADVLVNLAGETSELMDTRSIDDETIREALKRELENEVGLNMGVISVTVKNGAVELRGIVSSANKKKAAEVAAEYTPGVRSVRNRLTEIPAWMWAA